MRPQSRAANAVDHYGFKFFAVGGGNFAIANLGGKLVNLGEELTLGVCQAIGKVGDFAFFIRVFDGPVFNLLHFPGGPGKLVGHIGQIIRREIHAGKADGEIAAAVIKTVKVIAFNPIVHIPLRYSAAITCGWRLKIFSK